VLQKRNSGKAKRLLALSVSAAAMLGFVSLGSAPAKAAESSGPDTETGMYLAGFDAAVAHANGYEVVTLPDGSQASVPADKAEAARTGSYVPTVGILKAPRSRGEKVDSAYDEKAGECGRSYVSLNERGNQAANLGTGFFVDNGSAGNPWDVHWHVSILDNGGVSSQNYSEEDGRLAGNAWLARNRVLHLTRGFAYANVKTSSVVITTRGWICYSYGPKVEEFIY
jgi:hypothetical protein